MSPRQKAYREFLKSSFWKELSARVKKKAGRCKRCKAKGLLQAHHKFYREDWYETQESDLMVLCRKCHAIEHGLAWNPSYGPRALIIYRDDWRFSVILYRIDCLTKRLYTGRPLRPRDDSFLDNALTEYPPTAHDSCMAFKVRLVRQVNMKAIKGVYAIQRGNSSN